MKTDITDKLTPEMRQRWLDYFEDQIAVDATMASMLRANAAQQRNLNRIEHALWVEFRSAFPVGTQGHITADLTTNRLYLTEPGYAEAKGEQ